MTNVRRKKLFNHMVSMNFLLFLEKVFETLHPGELPEKSRHLDVFAWYVNEIVERRMPRLDINLPPRSLKSLTFNIALSAWELGHNPKARIPGVSCTTDLARKHSNDTRKVMKSELTPRPSPRQSCQRIQKTISRRQSADFDALPHQKSGLPAGLFSSLIL